MTATAKKHIKRLQESTSDDERIQLLADYLGIEAEEISHNYGYEYETPEGDYLVVDEDEARELAEEEIKNFIDELGIGSFTESFRDWIIYNALDTDWFEDAVREYNEFYVQDIESEDDDEFGNRLIQELYETNILTDDDFEVDEDGNPIYTQLLDTVDLDEKSQEYVDSMTEDCGDPVEYCADNFGWDWVKDMAEQNNCIDIDAIVDEAIEWDGIAHFLARYDGDEIELEDGYYAYRTN